MFLGIIFRILSDSLSCLLRKLLVIFCKMRYNSLLNNIFFIGLTIVFDYDISMHQIRIKI